MSSAEERDFEEKPRALCADDALGLKREPAQDAGAKVMRRRAAQMQTKQPDKYGRSDEMRLISFESNLVSATPRANQPKNVSLPRVSFSRAGIHLICARASLRLARGGAQQKARQRRGQQQRPSKRQQQQRLEWLPRPTGKTPRGRPESGALQCSSQCELGARWPDISDRSCGKRTLRLR